MLLILFAAMIICVYRIYLMKLMSSEDNPIMREVRTLLVVTVAPERLEAVKQSLPILVNGKTSASVLMMHAFGYVGKTESRPILTRSVGTNATEVAAQQYDVSMIVVFSATKYCVIDNEMYQEGEALSNTTFIKRIESNRILLSENKRERWIGLAGS